MTKNGRVVLIALQWVMLFAIIVGVLTLIGAIGAYIMAGILGTTVIADVTATAIGGVVLAVGATIVMSMAGELSQHIV